MPIQQRPRNHPKAICIICIVALQARKQPIASAAIGGRKQGLLNDGSSYLPRKTGGRFSIKARIPFIRIVCQFSSAPETIQRQFVSFALLLCRLESNR